MNEFTYIEDMAFCNDAAITPEHLQEYYTSGYFCDSSRWAEPVYQMDTKTIRAQVPSRLTRRMSDMSLGICYVMQEGPAKSLTPAEEIYLFTGFGEIETTRKIIDNIKIDGDNLVSPTLFHNSVHNTPLGYFTIINKVHNYCTTITDGRSTTASFINFINLLTGSERSAIITTGDESSGLFDLDDDTSNTIVPFFTAYRIKPNSKRGFCYLAAMDDLSQVQQSSAFKEAGSVICDLETFNNLGACLDKEILTDFPMTRNNPTAIAWKLAMPFFLKIKGKTMIIEKSGTQYHCYKVLL